MKKRARQCKHDRVVSRSILVEKNLCGYCQDVRDAKEHFKNNREYLGTMGIQSWQHLLRKEYGYNPWDKCEVKGGCGGSYIRLDQIFMVCEQCGLTGGVATTVFGATRKFRLAVVAAR